MSKKLLPKPSVIEEKPAPKSLVRVFHEAAFLGLVLSCVYLCLVLATYSHSDPGWSKTGIGYRVENAGGPAGAWIADVFFSLFGFIAYIFPALLAYLIWRRFQSRKRTEIDALIVVLKLIGLFLVVVSAAGLVALQWGLESDDLPFSKGGYLGLMTAESVNNVFGLLGGTWLLFGLFLFGMTLLADISWLALIKQSARGIVSSGRRLAKIVCEWRKRRLERIAQRRVEKQLENERKRVERAEAIRVKQAAKAEKVNKQKKGKPAIKPMKKTQELSQRAQKERQQTLFDDVPLEGELPPIRLLEPANKRSEKGYSEASLESMSRLLEEKLKDFGVIAEVVAVLPGPVVTRFEIQPAAGVKVSKITSLAKDLARSLAVNSVRVVEIIQGKSVVGVEIPNEHREMVRLSEVIASAAYEKSKSPITMALGHDISGDSVIADLAKMPHLLVAGTTGSGKSVGVNSMLISMLYKATPEEVRLILVDPKMLELSVYEGIPHLLTPVITDMKDAATGLRWCVGEMERRYKLMANLGVRNLAGFNKKIQEARQSGEPITDPLWVPEDDGVIVDRNATAPELDTLPFIVVVIDEFADMMMIVGKKVEQLIARIAQKARAAGIHLILATQRPSVDVITGLIKANVPTRMAFQVSSKVDSRTILDQGGAEQLLGHGDMLFLPPGTALTVRVHGAFVDDHEVHRVVADWKKRGAPDYLDEILSESTESIPVPGFSTEGEDDAQGAESDALYDEAVAFVTESRRASISAVQRKFRIGYNRAARLIEQMEASGVVTEMGSNSSREVLAPPPPKS